MRGDDVRRAALAITALLPLLASAQEPSEAAAPRAPSARAYAFASAGPLFALGDDLKALGLDVGMAVELGAGYRVARHLAVELATGYASWTNHTSSLVRTADAPGAPIAQLEADRALSGIPVLASMRLSTEWRRIELFAVVGGGVSFTSYDLASGSTSSGTTSVHASDAVFVLSGGAGASVLVARDVSIGIQARYAHGTATYRRGSPPSTTTQSAGDLEVPLDSVTAAATVACRF
jgi:hypothetical protein